MQFSAGPPPSKAWLLLLVLPMIGALFGAYVMVAPVSLAYRLDPAALTVEAKLGVINEGEVVRRADIVSAERVRIHGAHRRAGTALSNYCTGAWTLDGVGDVKLASDCGPEVITIHTASHTLAISPPDPDAFLATLQDPSGVTTVEVPMAPRAPGLVALAGVVALLPALVAVLLVRVLRPLTYRVEGGELVVPRHYGELRVPLRGVVVRPGDLRRALRMAGTGMPGLHLGAYRDAEGGFHACGTRRDEGLMVLASRRIYVTPEDREGFLAAVRAAGAVV